MAMDPPTSERIPHESPQAYISFLAYRDLGPGRTLAKLHANPPPGRKVVIRQRESLSSKHRWVERCRIWDAKVQAAKDRAAIEEAQKGVTPRNGKNRTLSHVSDWK
jgi:hypothetical protein